jgi:hypothetical protein
MGGAFVVAGLYGWVMEPSVDDEAPHDHHDEPEPEPEGDDAAEAAADEEQEALVD